MIVTVLGDQAAQIGHVARQRRQVDLAATGSERVDLGRQMRDLVLDMLMVVAGAVPRQARDLGLQPGERLQDRLEMVASGELVESAAEGCDLRLERMGEIAAERRGWALLRSAAARLRRKAGAEPAQILAQGRDAVLCLLGALVRRFFLAVEQTLARADVCDGCGKSVPAEGQPGERSLACCWASLARRSISTIRSPMVLIASAMTLVARSWRSAAARSPEAMRSSVCSIQRAIESSAPAVRVLVSRVSFSAVAAWRTSASISERDGLCGVTREAVSVRP